MNSILSIVIPTYNRPEILFYNLSYILEDLIEFSIPVYISDDSLDDKTLNAILELKKKHPPIFYLKNNPSLGHDKNCIRSLSLAKSDYIWYLGDSMIIKKGAIKKILSIIAGENPDFICFKEENRKINFATQSIYLSKEILSNLSWHLTMSGVTIYRKDMLQLDRFPVEKFKNFPQLALIFYNFINDQSKLVWLNEPLIFGNLKKESYWSKEVFSVFFHDFKNALTHLPQKFDENEIDKVVRDHSVKSQLFGYHSLVLMRINNVLNRTNFKLYYEDLKKYTDKSIFLYVCLLLFPRSVLAFFYKIIKKAFTTKKALMSFM